ncbi:MAG TPA: T9SS type A sorting domain-containing protein [Chitinophagaceae bacterium]|nr:T9SS type A sorting domain-containing protein [Chitinophagaceae bacterium]
MKKLLPIFALLSIACAHAQVTSPVIKANFGVDGELKSNFFNGSVISGSDDWFSLNGGTGEFIIDTTGAQYILSRYARDPAFRRIPFFRGMRFPQFSNVNNRMLIDGMFIREYHGTDSTAFATGSNKNGMSPATWTCPVSQDVPDKNDILDIMMHVRREGPNSTDSLWLIAGVSIENTTGNRYFDYEMYQTDIHYNRSTRTFEGYGPHDGHTSWQFDAAGNITRAGDIIFTAEFGTGGIQVLEARIWVHSSTRSSVTPVAFSWGTEFDGAGNGAAYGYANILPKVPGDFYTGLHCGNNTWAGAFNVVRQNNTVSEEYTARQFMEFSVNLSKLGLDPIVTTSDPCAIPFRRILVKTRASNSFTAELKDFVAPFEFFRAPAAEAAADVPLYCGTPGVSNINVTNPILTSQYTWSTPNGNIVSDSVGPSITVNAPGIYIVTQQLMGNCGTSYAHDTVEIILDSNCALLKTSIKDFRATQAGRLLQLNWTVSDSRGAAYFRVERSTDAQQFEAVGKLWPHDAPTYGFTDDISAVNSNMVYYRIKTVDPNGSPQYSKIVALQVNGPVRPGVTLMPNPVRNEARLLLSAPQSSKATITIYDLSGTRLRTTDIRLSKGAALVDLENFAGWPRGVYLLKITIGNVVFTEKMILAK